MKIKPFSLCLLAFASTLLCGRHIHAATVVKNGDFSSGTSPWTLYFNNSGAASLSVTSSPVFGKVTITNLGTTTAKANVGLRQTILADLAAGQEYTISFTAKASVAKSIDVILYSAGNSILWAQYGVWIPANPATTSPSYTFTPTSTQTGAWLAFRLGGSNNPGDVFLSNVAVNQSPKLTWSPPPLSAPITKYLGATGSAGVLAPGQDYIIKLSSTVTRTERVVVNGGRNVKIVGGHVHIPDGVNSAAFSIWDGDPNRVVHLEGILVTHADSAQGDAFVIDAPNSIVQIQNVRTEHLNGAYGSGYNHTDIIQPWGGCKELRVDRLTGSSNYQGLFLKSDYDPNLSFIFKNINMVAEDQWFSGSMGAVMVWLDEGITSGSGGVPTSFTNVFIIPRPGKILESVTVWPDKNNPTVSKRPIVTNNYLTWPGLPYVTGGIYGGAPVGGDYVPAGSVGLNYVSPGYR